MYTLRERLYKTADGRLVPEGDPDARLLFGVPGRRIPDKEAARYGLLGDQAVVEEEPESEEPSEEGVGELAEPESPEKTLDSDPSADEETPTIIEPESTRRRGLSARKKRS